MTTTVEFHPNDTPEERVARYINEKNFTLKKCQRYVKNTFGKSKAFFKEDDCCCGHSVTWHLKQRSFHKGSAKSEEWSPQKDTAPYPCDTFGELAFRAGWGIDQAQIVPGAIAKYIRVERRLQNFEPYFENIFTLMTDRNLWNLPVPQLLIEVTGSAGELPHVDHRAIEKFHSGLIAAAKSASAWIVSGGANCGVMKLVGEAVTRSRMTHPDKVITCVGIVSWGVVKHREALVSGDDIGNNNAGARSPLLSSGPKLSPRQGGSKGSNYLTVDMSVATGGGGRQRTTSENSFSPDVVGRWPADYVVERQEGSGDEPSLDPGHTAFLLVDNGREKLYGEEIIFRAQFLHFLSKKSIKASISESGTAVPRTPLVLLVIGGGPNTLETVRVSTAAGSDDDPTTLKANGSKKESKKAGKSESPKEESWPRPVIILPGFGGVGDILAFAYTITAPSEDNDTKLYRTSALATSETEASEFPPDFENRVKKHPAFKMLCVPANNKSEEDVIKSIKMCLQHRNLITVVDLFDDHDEAKVALDHAILNAIFKSNLQTEPATTFQLAQLWRRCDVAKRIFKQNGNEIRKSVDIKRAMTRAIETGESTFFEFFIEYGLIDLNSYLTPAQMRTFYEDIFIKRIGKAAKISCIQLFRSLLMNGTNDETLSDCNNPKFMGNVGEALASLLACYLDNVFTSESARRRVIIPHPDDEQQSDDANDGSSQRRGSYSSESNERNHRPYDTSHRDLFILLLLLHRQDMALKVWKTGHDHIGSALMAAIFLKSLAREANRLDMVDLAMDLEEHATLWQDKAIRLLDFCYEQDPVRCNRLLSRSLLTWQGLTILEMAYYGKKKRIMEHPAIQTKLAQIWLGRMATFTRFELIYWTMFPPLLPLLIFRIRFEESPVFQRPPEEIAAVNALLAASTSALAAVAMPSVSRRYSIFPNGNKDELLDPKLLDTAGSGCARSCLGRISPEGSSSSDAKPLGSSASPFGPKKYIDKKLLRATLCGVNQPQKISVFTAIYFLYASPIAKYVTHSLALLIFLLIFTAFVLVGADPDKVSKLEIIIWIASIVYFADLVREGFGKQNLRFSEKMEDFFSDTWSRFDVSAMILLIAAIIQRFTVPSAYFVYPRTTYAVACVTYWIKSLHIFYVMKSLGPKVATLFKMIRDVAFFVIIYFIILLAFAAPIHALMRPNAKIETVVDFLAVLLDVAYFRMWNIFVIGMEDSRHMVEGTCSGKINKPIEASLESHNKSSSENATEAAFSSSTSHYSRAFSSESGNATTTAAVMLALNATESWQHAQNNLTATNTTERSLLSSLAQNVTESLTTLAANASTMLLEATTMAMRGEHAASNKEHTLNSKLELNGTEVAEAIMHGIREGAEEGEPCSDRNIIAIILYIIFLLLTNIVLLNMLIAMFAHTVDEARVSAERLWRFNIYRFVNEYYKKPVLPGPLMIFELVHRTITSFLRKKSQMPMNTDFKEFYVSIEEYEYRKLEMFERSAVQTLMAEIGEEAGKGQTAVVKKLRHVHEKLEGKMERIEERLNEVRGAFIEKFPKNNADSNED